MFQSEGTLLEQECLSYNLVLTDGMHSIQLSVEDQSCLEGMQMLNRSETEPVKTKEFAQIPLL